MQYLNASIEELTRANSKKELTQDLITIRDWNSDEKWQANEIQKLSLNWTGQDEENFRYLKLLRMKAFGTL